MSFLCLKQGASASWYEVHPGKTCLSLILAPSSLLMDQAPCISFVVVTWLRQTQTQKSWPKTSHKYRRTLCQEQKSFQSQRQDKNLAYYVKHLVSPPLPQQAKQSPFWIWIPGARGLSHARDSESGRVLAPGSDQQHHRSKTTTSLLSLWSRAVCGWLVWEETEHLMKAVGPNSAESNSSQCIRNVLWPFLIDYLLLKAPERKDRDQCREVPWDHMHAESGHVCSWLSCSYPHQLPTLLISPTGPSYLHYLKGHCTFGSSKWLPKKSDSAAHPHRNSALLVTSQMHKAFHKVNYQNWRPSPEV